MFSTSDTIVAVATPPGRGGLGVVRLSGPAAQAIAEQLTTRTSPLVPRRATFTRISLDHAPVDHIVATFFPGPKSYTGDDMVEFSAHGSVVILRAIVAGAVGAGARLAEPGEFTLRAFLNGRIDLMQAEAVGDLIDAVTPLQARVAFDQLDGTLTGVITEISNSLFDLIARLEASVDFPDEGYHFLEPGDLKGALDGLVVVDDSAPLEQSDLEILMYTADYKRLIVSNKSDIADNQPTTNLLSVSAKTGDGLDALREKLTCSLDIELSRDRPAISNLRHITLVRHAHEAICRAIDAATPGGGLPEEFLLADLQQAQAALDEVSGKRAPEDLLEHIFSRFCVGK